MRVAELWRYPVKSLRGERLDRVELERDGFRGDRLTRVLGPDGSHVTGRTAPGLLGLEAGIGARGEPLVDGEPWDSEAAGERIEAVAALGEDRRRLRPNVVVEGVAGLGERDWVGRRLRLGPAELLVREPCERCVMTTIDPDTLEIRPDVLRRINDDFEGLMGVYCEVALPGTIQDGDPVELH